MVSLRRNKLNTVGASEGATKTYVRSKVNELAVIADSPTVNYYPIYSAVSPKTTTANSPMYRNGTTNITTLPDTLQLTRTPGAFIGQDFSLHVKGEAGASVGRNTGRLQLGLNDNLGGLIYNLGTSTHSYTTTTRSPLQIGGADALGSYYDCLPSWSFWLSQQTSGIGNTHFIVQLPDNPTHGDVYWLNFGIQGLAPAGTDTIGFYLKPSTTPSTATKINGSTSNLEMVLGDQTDFDVNLWRAQYVDHISHNWRGWFVQKMTSSLP